MTKTITLFEHEAIAFEWTDQDVRRLDHLHRLLGIEILRPIWVGSERCLQAQQHVGIVRIGAQTIQVLPKIYSSDITCTEQSRARSATQNLLYLLSYAAQTPVRESGIMTLE